MSEFNLKAAEYETRKITVDWKNIDGDVIYGGTPMSRDGKIANNANAYGIVSAEQLMRGYIKDCEVIVSGAINLDAAETHSGIKITPEAKAAMSSIWFSAEYHPEWGTMPYVEEKTIVILPETTKNFTREEDDDPTDNSSPAGEFYVRGLAKMVVGETYILNYDGVEYELVAEDFYGLVMLEPKINGARPIAVAQYASGVILVQDSTEGKTEATVSVVQKKVTANKLDKRCLPDDATELVLVSPNGTKYAVTVSDSGELSAAAVTE